MIATILIAIVALLHLYILVLEMSLWQAPATRKNFGTTAELAAMTKTLTGNQELQNGFLAAGLLWTLLLGRAGASVALIFLGCVCFAGVYGAATVSRRILFVQSVPAELAILAVLARF